MWPKSDPFCAKMHFLQYGQFLGFCDFVHLVDVFVIFEPVSEFFVTRLKFLKMCQNVSNKCAQKTTKKHTLKNAQENEVAFWNYSQKQGPPCYQKSGKKVVHKCCVFAILSVPLSLVILMCVQLVNIFCDMCSRPHLTKLCQNDHFLQFLWFYGFWPFLTTLGDQSVAFLRPDFFVLFIYFRLQNMQQTA